jgi:hypothetical protein
MPGMINAKRTPAASKSNCISNATKNEMMANAQQAIDPSKKAFILSAEPEIKVLKAYRHRTMG